MEALSRFQIEAGAKKNIKLKINNTLSERDNLIRTDYGNHILSHLLSKCDKISLTFGVIEIGMFKAVKAITFTSKISGIGTGYRNRCYFDRPKQVDDPQTRRYVKVGLGFVYFKSYIDLLVVKYGQQTTSIKELF
jgi:hypothetical protein